MMERVDISGQEEYIWAMRSLVKEASDYDLWQGRIEESEEAEVYQKRSKTKPVEEIPIDYQAQVLASLVPDEIIYSCNSFEPRMYDGCLLFGDVSGFTDLCEKYNKTGKGGPSRLTQVLNSYIGTMIQEILSYNGDVLKFSGDAFLAMFKTTQNNSMQDCVHLALDCALTIQKTHGSYETDVAVFLRVKLAISAGDILFSIIGFPNMCHYVAVGQPIWDVKDAERLANPGEIIVSQQAWDYINPTEYHVEYMEGGPCIKVRGLGLNWRSPLRSGGKTDKVVQQQDVDSHSSRSEDSMEEDDSIDEFSLRPSVNDAVKLGIKQDLRKFILPVIMRGIDMNEPLDYLTEMRQIVMLFINVVPRRIELTEFLKLVDKCYKVVLSVTDPMEGCVNKVSLFDKDLMFVVIFGFRGFKHENECQLGLRCASECYRRLRKITHVISTSIGVTTGITYCGIVGHTLRREYTVIGLSVNKAARLMSAYSNKVTCDRDTFLHSKMEAKNFVLQEFRTLKGIINAGPIYEFKEACEIRGMDRQITKYPLLGRDGEIRTYQRMLGSVGRESSYFVRMKHSSTTAILKTVFHISADAKQGKSRLLDEFIYVTPEHIPVARFSLSADAFSISYNMIRLFFSLPLDILPNASLLDRQIRLRQRLKLMLVPELLCILNEVFLVNFPKSKLYLRLTEQQKTIVRTKMIKQLCYGTFPYMWSIMIENAEYMDEESWPLISAIFETGLVLITITTSSCKQMGEHCRLYLENNPRVAWCHLTSMDNWYHVGFACQILNVYAIPAELEKVIQTKSNGNAGWIESFLISLMQGGGLYVQNVDISAINDLGLVMPPIEMLMRLDERDVEQMEKEQGIVADKNIHGWKMYMYCYRDSHSTLIKSTLQQKLDKVDVVPICLISPNVNIADVDAELSIDVLIMKTFDSLSSFEQKLLKCSAVIGDIFHRKMLEYVMNCKDPHTTAIAVKKLFDIQVMCCGMGDFTMGDTFSILQKRSFFKVKMTDGIKCDCIGIKIPDTMYKFGLPKYAFCGFLRFKLPTFRDTMYTLLTDNQKKEFHGRAMTYLEIETRRCRACGNGIFTHILGKKHTHTDEFNKSRFVKKVKKNRSATNDDIPTVILRKESEQMMEEERPYSRRDTVTSLHSESFKTLENSSSQEFLFPKSIGIHTVNAYRYRATLMKTFSNFDFSSCQCPEILDTMYKQMVDHCLGAGLTEKLLSVMLEYGHLCILSYNTPQALKILNLAMSHVNSSQMVKEIDLVNKDWKTPLVRADILTLKGYARLELGQYVQALTLFYKAMTNYGYPFPTNPNQITLKTRWLTIKLNGVLLCCSKHFIHSKTGNEANFCDNVSTCLTLLCNVFMILNMWTNAELAAVWSLHKALAADQDFPTICSAYANLITIMHHFKRDSTSIALEVHSLCLCHRKKHVVERCDLTAVAKLYTAIFRTRFLRSELQRSTEMGLTMLRICGTIHSTMDSLKMYPLLTQALFMQCRVDEAVFLLNDLDHIMDDDIDNSGRTWYYALAIQLHLETGYNFTSFKRCEKYINVEGEHVNTNRDLDSKRRYFTVMWLWCIRIQDYEAANIWQVKAHNMLVLRDNDSLENLFTGLYHLEGILLYISDKTDRKNLAAVTNSYNVVDHMIQLLEKSAIDCRVIEPRLWHLKAFYRIIRYNDKRGLSMLGMARRMAIQRGNVLEQMWIAHSESAWTNDMNSFKRNFWRDHTSEEMAIDYHEYENNDCNIIQFTLEPPQFF